jgi:ribosome recycling factor
MDKIDFLKVKEELEKTSNHFKESLNNAVPQSGNLGVLNSLKVKAYGQVSSLKELALLNNISSGEVEIKPYDKTLLKDIEKSIWDAQLGTVRAGNNSLIFVFPPVSSESNQRAIQSMKKLLEDVKVSIRHIRRKFLDTIEHIKKTQKDSYERQEKELQKVIDDFTGKTEDMFKLITSKIK